MKGLVLLSILSVAFVVVSAQSSEEDDECHALFMPLGEHCAEQIKTCADGLDISMPDTLHMKRIVRTYFRLSDEEKKDLSACLFEAKEVLNEDGTFDAEALKEGLVDAMTAGDLTDAVNATLNAIEEEYCVLEDGEDLRPVFKFMHCLMENCEDEMS